MKILFLTTHLNTGGITSYLYTLCKGLRRNDQKIFIVSSGGEREKDFRALGVEIWTIPIKTKSELDIRIYLFLGRLKKLIKDNDIRIIHAHTRITQVMGRILKIITGVTFVTTCHGYFKPRLSRRIAPCWGDGVIAISDAVAKHLYEDFCVAEQKITVINSGVDCNEFSPGDDQQREEIRKQLCLKKNMTIGMIARLSDVKGQDILIRAMPNILESRQDIQLLLIGQGRTEGVLKDIVKELNLQDDVIFSPVVNRTEKYLPVFDVFIVPSRQEGLGLSILEAQAAGIPVVASSVGGIPSLIQDGLTGRLVEPEDPKLLAEAVLDLLKNKDQRKKIAHDAREFVKQNYLSESMIEGVLRFYRTHIKKEVNE